MGPEADAAPNDRLSSSVLRLALGAITRDELAATEGEVSGWGWRPSGPSQHFDPAPQEGGGRSRCAVESVLVVESIEVGPASATREREDAARDEHRRSEGAEVEWESETSDRALSGGSSPEWPSANSSELSSAAVRETHISSSSAGEILASPPNMSNELPISATAW